MTYKIGDYVYRAAHTGKIAIVVFNSAYYTGMALKNICVNPGWKADLGVLVSMTNSRKLVIGDILKFQLPLVIDKKEFNLMLEKLIP